jgi:hypothetical protein
MKALTLGLLLLVGCSNLAEQVEFGADKVGEVACGWDRESPICPEGDPPDDVNLCVQITSGDHTLLVPYGAKACEVIDRHYVVVELGECVSVYTQHSAKVTPTYQMAWVPCP